MTLTLNEYLPVKQLMESEALLRHHATPLLTRGQRKGKPTLHLADASSQALASSPALWCAYRAAIAAGLPSEFMRPKSKPAMASEADRIWFAIERLARGMVASSVEPITLRSAVARVVTADPTLRDRYLAALRKARRARGGRV